MNIKPTDVQDVGRSMVHKIAIRCEVRIIHNQIMTFASPLAELDYKQG